MTQITQDEAEAFISHYCADLRYLNGRFHHPCSGCIIKKRCPFDESGECDKIEVVEVLEVER